ncbi:MAG: CRISPR-associated protein Cas4 [Candidatus Freyarchaeota archaeon]|nr:CRISPR-associated protein Cas4 [Candidatus Jordarchaeia archaeon]
MGGKGIWSTTDASLSRPTSDVAETTISVTDIKHYIYCPRIVYFERVLHSKPKLGSQQQKSKESHAKQEKKEAKRQDAAPYLPEPAGAKKHFNVPLYSPTLNLQGTLDLLIENGTELIPIEYKDTASNNGKPWTDHKYQLAAYVLLAEEKFGGKARKGYLHYIPEKLTIQVEITQTMKTHVKRILSHIKKIITEEKLPPVRVDPKKCTGGCGHGHVCMRL